MQQRTGLPARAVRSARPLKHTAMITPVILTAMFVDTFLRKNTIMEPGNRIKMGTGRSAAFAQR